MDVKHIGRCDVVGMEHADRASQPVQFVAVIELPLRGAVAVWLCAVDVAASHGAALGTGRLADLDGLRVDDGTILSTVDFPGNLPADFLVQPRRHLASVVVLPPGYDVGHLVPVLG